MLSFTFFVFSFDRIDIICYNRSCARENKPFTLISFTDNAYDYRKTKGTQTSSIRDVCYADRNGYRFGYNGYASTSYYLEFMSDILIEEMEDNISYNRFPMNKPNTLNDYRIYFGKERFGQLLAQHFLRGHHKDTIDMTMELEYLEKEGTDIDLL